MIGFDAEGAPEATVAANGVALPTRAVNGHLVIPPMHRRRGENTVRITFRAGEAPLDRSDDFLCTWFVPANARRARDARGVSFRRKGYRPKGRTRYKTMTLTPREFMRRFPLHALPGGFHRIRHDGSLASGTRNADLARARQALHVVAATADNAERACTPSDASPPAFVCLHPGARDAHRAQRRARRGDPRATTS